MPKGEKNKLTTEQRTEILALHGQESGHKVARDYGVSHTAIYKIWRKKGNQKETIDTVILKKLIPVFATVGVKVDLDVEEIARIQELSTEVA